MRPLGYDAEIGGGNVMDKRSMDLEHAKEAWDEWEIHFLILLSRFLQVFLCLTADLRRRSASRLLSNVLWLAYLSADTVAVFVLGHLAVHAQGPRHELMLFWAPFVLVHLGGQDTITAFSKQDNELWTRHLLGLVTQTAVAGYVVSKSSWPDIRLRTAMVLMFLCGFLKYAGRTYCLYSASPKILRSESMDRLSLIRLNLQEAQKDGPYGRWQKNVARQMFEDMFGADRHSEFEIDLITKVDEIMLVDAPVDDLTVTIAADALADIMKDFRDLPDRCIAYQHVATYLVDSYQLLYTKAPLGVLPLHAFRCCEPFQCLMFISLFLTSTLFQCICTTTALGLVASAYKEGHHSKADITVSYILLVGAIVLDLLPASMSIVSIATKLILHGTRADCAEKISWICLQPRRWLTRKQWSEELAQYSMTRRYSSTSSVEDYNGCMPLLRKWIHDCKPMGDWCADFFDTLRTPVTDDLKLFILDRLLLLQTRRQEWDFASFRGQRALGKWMGNRHQVLEQAERSRSGYDALHDSLSSRVDFPASVLIWHIATDICYFSGDERISIEPADETKKKMVISREVSYYIIYLVFKCDVMLTTNSRLVHEKAQEQLREYFQQVEVHLDDKETVMVMFEAMKKEATKKAEQQQGSTPPRVAQDNKDEEPANKDVAVADATSSKSGIQESLKRMEEAIYTPVLPRAHAVAQELIRIEDEASRWELISEVWLEMLFYTAPRCGTAFHYEHLSTGGEFITHVLYLMRSLGPFMPKPAGA